MAMHLASMVHGSGREREAHEHHRHLQHHSNYYPQVPQNRSYEASSSPYPPPQPPVEYQQYHRAPQSPPSPPVEEQKPSLPSISSLLGVADGRQRADSETASSPKSQQQQPSPQLRQEAQRQSTGAVQQVESRPDQATHAFGPAIVSNPRITLPPTPPMQPDSVVDGNQSPSAVSSHSSISAGPYFLGGSINNMEPHQQRQNVAPTHVMKRQSVPPQTSMSPYNSSQFAGSPYQTSPGGASATSYYSPEPQSYNSVGMYGQRPLPSNYQPQMPPMPVQGNPQSASGVWQHHHYISASSQNAFPQSQDRYICSTCNKAFSRPSSLRIHSHSHTGEKPYKCPQPGCGKAFSVRSNMKRHERGCHATASATL